MLRAPARLSILFAVLLVSIGVTATVVSRAAQRAVLDSQAGAVVEVVNDPDAPGFRAFTNPTPVAAVLHTTIEDARPVLRSASVLIASGPSGGTIISVPSHARAEGGSTVEEAFDEAGLDGAVAVLHDLFGVAFGELVVLDAESWTTLMQRDLPLSMTLRTDLVSIDRVGASQTLVPAGSRSYELADVAIVAAHRNPGESPLGVAERHQEIWRSWISRTAQAQEPPSLFRVGAGFVDLLGQLTSAEVSYLLIPARASDAETFDVDVGALQDILVDVVPMPRPPRPVPGFGVMVLDGGAGEVPMATLIADITRAGATVSVVGNAAEPQPTSVALRHAAPESNVGAALADVAARADLDVEDREGDDPSIAVTVVLGLDRAPAS